jgi:hypothetical protein
MGGAWFIEREDWSSPHRHGLKLEGYKSCLKIKLLIFLRLDGDSLIVEGYINGMEAIMRRLTCAK